MTASDSDIALGTKDTLSTPSLKGEKSLRETPEHSTRTLVPGHEESEELKEKKEKTLETLDNNWETDPANARNWPTYKKWVSMSIVRQTVYMFLTHTNHFL